MYELIIFTMLMPHVEPKWTHLEPTSLKVCLSTKRNLSKDFIKVKGLVYSISCMPVKISNSE